MFAWRGETVDDFWFCIEKCFEGKNWKPNIILDDGGDATNFCQAKHPNIFKNLIGKCVCNYYIYKKYPSKSPNLYTNVPIFFLILLSAVSI